MLTPDTASRIIAADSRGPEEDEAAEALIALHTRTVDALNGYVKMVEKAEPEFLGVAEQFRGLHARHADILARLLAQRGIEADDDGSFMGSVNRAVVSVRAFVDQIDEDVMDNVRSGEQHVLKAFDEALASPLVAEEQANLREMRDALTDLLAETSDLG